MPTHHPPNNAAPVFITIATYRRMPCFASASDQARLLTVLRAEREIRPFAMLAYVILTDHLHLLFRPAPRQDYVKIVGSVKANYSRRLCKEMGVSAPMLIWQKGFWDHLIRNEEDLARHIDYIHYNPVRHGYVTKPEDWASSSFQEWQRRGKYAPMWGWHLPDTIRAIEIPGMD